jgi:hypothetical protein
MSARQLGMNEAVLYIERARAAELEERHRDACEFWRKACGSLRQRVQEAEKAARVTVEECRRRGLSLGRDLANYAATTEKERADRLAAAITDHHAQKADDRCIEDDDRLYAAAGLPPCDRRVGDKAAMLANCARFIERRCEGGGWPSYVELERQLAEAREALQPFADEGETLPDTFAFDWPTSLKAEHFRRAARALAAKEGV